MNNETKLIDLDTSRENAIGNYNHYCLIGDHELASMWELRIQDIEDEMLSIWNELKGKE